MRNVADAGHARFRSVALAVTILMLSAAQASAQLVFDGNLLFNNGNTGTVAGQCVGAPTAAVLTCPLGYNAGQLATISFPHNFALDPLLHSAAYPTGSPNFQPSLGSPAYSQAVTLPNDGFFQQTCYVGAIGPDPADDWTQGWSYFDSTGATRQDLHLAGMPNPRPLVIHDNIIANTDQFWGADSNHLVRGQFRVQGGANLTIAAGTVIFEERATIGTIRIDRTSKIFAIGKRDSAIIITTDDAPGTMHTGGGGGLVLNGLARVNNANSCAGDSAASEGGNIGFYGGNDDHDNKGILRYVRIEYAGKEITPNNELNSFTNNALGDGTQEEFLEAFRGADDGWEAFGGTVSPKHLLLVDGRDDGFDWQQGYRGKAQFVIVRGVSDLAPSGTQFGDKAIEADNNDVAPFTQLVCSGRSNPTVANFTMVGDRTRTGAAFPGSDAGVNLRRATAGQVLNSIVTNFKTSALKIDDDVTWTPHCAAIPAAPALFCSAATTGVPVGEGRVLVTNSAPNPFRNRLNLHFTLPAPGRVTVMMFSADGRLVDTLANGEMAAGDHSLEWKVSSHTPSGVYFYKVFANGVESTGKVVRVD